MTFEIGDEVFHKTFGWGKVLSVAPNYVDVFFNNFGRRSIINEMILKKRNANIKKPEKNTIVFEKDKEVVNKVEQKPAQNISKPNVEEKTKVKKKTKVEEKTKVFNIDLIKLIVEDFSKQEIRAESIDYCSNIINKTYSCEMENRFIARSLEPYVRIVFLQHLNSMAKKIEKGKNELFCTYVNCEKNRLKKTPNKKILKKETNRKVDFTNSRAIIKSLKSQLDKEIYLVDDYKQILKKNNILINRKSFEKSLESLCFYQRTKRIILKNKYRSIKEFFKTEILKNEVYRYSNPLNLYEYDDCLKALNKELLILDVGNGVYLTKKNMEKNGINNSVINSFKKELRTFGKNEKIFSYSQICNKFYENKVIQYCNGDVKQFIQFAKTIEEFKTIKINNDNVLYIYSKSKQYKEAFFNNLLREKNSIEIYDIETLIEEYYDIIYRVEDIEKDISKTSFYYSEEMEKIYKSKEFYIKEVYYDGN